MKLNSRIMLLSSAMVVALGTLANPRVANAASSTDNKIFTLEAVTFDGNHRVTTDTLNNVCGLHVGQKVNRQSIVDAFQDVIAEYKKENVGGQIQPQMLISGNTMKVMFKIAEAAPPQITVVKPILDHETFTGNHKVSSDKLSAVLSIKPGTEVTKDLVESELQSILKVYKAAGIGAKISPKVTELPANHIDLNFDITESNGSKPPRDTSDPSD